MMNDGRGGLYATPYFMHSFPPFIYKIVIQFEEKVMSKNQSTTIEWLTIQRKIAEDNMDKAAAILQKEREFVMKNEFCSHTSTPIEVPEYIIPFMNMNKQLDVTPDKNQGFPNGKDDNEDRLNATSPNAPNTSYSNPGVEAEKAQLKMLLSKYAKMVKVSSWGNTFYEVNL
jgi:hypothetical protein